MTTQNKNNGTKKAKNPLYAALIEKTETEVRAEYKKAVMDDATPEVLEQYSRALSYIARKGVSKTAKTVSRFCDLMHVVGLSDGATVRVTVQIDGSPDTEIFQVKYSPKKEGKKTK